MNKAFAVCRALIMPQRPATVAAHPRDDRDRDGSPLVSIVTVCLNRASTLQRTSDSVRAQSGKNIAYIVLDGGSTDGTVEVIRANEDIISFWRSAPDAGLYAALNEGVERSRGRFVQFVHADDWLDEQQIARAVEVATSVYCDLVHGDLMMHRAQGGEWLRVGDDGWFPLEIAALPRISHPTVLARRAVYERIGLFRTDLRIASDVDWLLRAAHAGLLMRYCPLIRSHMSEGGISTVQQRLALAEFVALLAHVPRRSVPQAFGALWLMFTHEPAVQRAGAYSARVGKSLRAWLERNRLRARRIIINGLHATGLIGSARIVYYKKLARWTAPAPKGIASGPPLPTRAMRAMRRTLVAVLRATGLIGPVRASYRLAAGIAAEPIPLELDRRILARFAELRFARADLDDAAIARLVENAQMPPTAASDDILGPS